MAKVETAAKPALVETGEKPQPLRRENPMRLKALKTYRCGEPGKSPTAPPAAIKKLMVKAFGEYGRIFVGGLYPRVPRALAEALIKDKAAEVDIE